MNYRFRWAELQLKEICKILRPSSISAALYKMPRTLDKTYERVLSAIYEEYSDEVKSALYWLAFSARPITVAELAEACSIRIAHDAEPSLEDCAYEAVTGLLEAISSFVLLEEPTIEKATSSDSWPRKFVKASDRSVRLAHYSVKEYLVSNRLRDQESHISKYRLEESHAERILSQICCAYVLIFTNHHDIRTWIDEGLLAETGKSDGCYLSPQDLRDFAPAFPLLDYACRYWYNHQKLAESRSDALPEHGHLHLKILDNERVRVAWLRLGNGKIYLQGSEAGRIQHNIRQMDLYDGTQAFYWAVLLGLRETVKLLYDREPKPEVNHVAGRYGFPLQAAAYTGDDEMVNLLLSRGTIPNLEGGYYGTALQAAVCAGDRGIVYKLLQAAPECVRSRNGKYGSALQAAIEGGDEKIVNNLLQAGADPNCPVKERPYSLMEMQVRATDTLLLLSVKTRNVGAIQMMIHYGSNIDLSSSELLSWIIKCESEELIQTLLQATNITDPILGEWLILAVRRAHKGIIRLLVGAGANLNSSSRVHSSAADAMLRNVEKGKAVVELLIELGLKIAGDHHLLLAAIISDLDLMVESLLSSGADIHGHGKSTGDALMTAAGRGNEALVKVLLRAGANPKAQHLYAWKYSEESNMRLHSALIKAMIYGITGLDGAFQSSLAIVQQLINAGVDVNDGGDALCEAIMFLHMHYLRRDRPVGDYRHFIQLMVQCLLANGADLSGPLGAVPSIVCASAHETVEDLVRYLMYRHAGPRERRQVLDQMHHDPQKNFNVHSMFVTSCSMLAHGSTIEFLQEEMEIEVLDLTRACEILSAACWSFRRPRRWSKPKEIEDRIRKILQTMVDAMGPNHRLFDELLKEDALRHSMGPYIGHTTPREHWVTKEYCVTKVRACLLRVKNTGE